MSVRNAAKTVRNILSGRSIAPLRSYFGGGYPLLWWFRPGLPRIRIDCILGGFPRTGTHWIQSVLDCSAGVKPFNMYSQKPAPSDGDVPLIKIHARSPRMARAKGLLALPPHSFGGKYLYALRDPRDAIISLYEMYRAETGRAELSPEGFVRMYDPVGQYRWEVRRWVLSRRPDVRVVRFEDLKADPLFEFEKIFAYLGIGAAVNPDSIGRRVSRSDSVERPRAKAGGWREAPPQYAWLVQRVTDELHGEIDALGYEAS